MRGTILIVDDSEGVRDTARLVLAREGYGILTAADGQTAMELMSTADISGQVRVLLTDLDMPNLNGKGLIDHFRMQFPSIPIVVLSGAPDTAFLDAIVQEGVCDWLRKPVTRDALLEKVRTAMNLYELRQRQG